MDIVEILKSFFNTIIANIDSAVNLVGSAPGLFSFVSYVWFFCIPDEITDIIILFCLIIIFLGFNRHSK